MRRTVFRFVGKMGFPWSELDGLRYCAEPSASGEIVHIWGDGLRSGCAYDELMGRLQKSVHGCYALVYANRSSLLLGADIVASAPLFYRVTDHEVLVSDDAGLISSERVDARAVSEYLCAMYTLGADTVDPEVKQVRAGERVGIDLATGEVSRFDEWTFSRTFEDDSPSLEELDDALLASVARSVKGHDGTVAVPLSGGFDSRSIAYALRRLGVSDVVCFSYGRPGNREAEVSRRIADALGYEWHFVEYSPRALARHIRGNYARAASGYFMLGRVPCVQTQMAFKTLKGSGTISDGALLLPGHTGDFVAGSHLDASLLASHGDPAEDAAESVIRRHLNLCSIPEGEPEAVKKSIGGGVFSGSCGVGGALRLARAAGEVHRVRPLVRRRRGVRVQPPSLGPRVRRVLEGAVRG